LKLAGGTELKLGLSRDHSGEPIFRTSVVASGSSEPAITLGSVRVYKDGRPRGEDVSLRIRLPIGDDRGDSRSMRLSNPFMRDLGPRDWVMVEIFLNGQRTAISGQVK